MESQAQTNFAKWISETRKSLYISPLSPSAPLLSLLKNDPPRLPPLPFSAYSRLSEPTNGSKSALI